ncbi:MAG: methylated-DNA--[protein]-cysteine S-methyltransferase [Chloroflexi bacterium]|nr:methylated-DNA--[protein]-cysteine S-methyltransferase [Chloroflexota bacterium]
MNKPPIFIGNTRTSALGEVWAAVSERGLVTVEYGVTRKTFETNVKKQTRRDVEYAPAQTSRVMRQIKEYVDGKRRDFDLVIDWSVLSSDFQRAALKVVFSIPYGETRTYADVAAQIGHPQAFRAMGRANATNPMPLVIPCHRVIGSDGKLHGYGGKGGLKTKEWLLKMERENKSSRRAE